MGAKRNTSGGRSARGSRNPERAGTGDWPWKDAAPPGEAIGYINSGIPDLPVKPVSGRTYEDRVPDTLDLAAMSELTINALTCATDPQQDHEMYFSLYCGNPMRMSHSAADWCTPKYIEALALLRVVTGSDFMSGVDQVWQDSILKSIGPDGLYYLPIKGKPWYGREDATELSEGIACADGSFFAMGTPDPRTANEPPGQMDGPAWGPVTATIRKSGISQFTHPYLVGRIMKVLTIYHLRDGNPLWLDLQRPMVDRMAELAVTRDDYAFFPAYIYEPGATYDRAKAAEPRGMTGGHWNARLIRGLALYFKRTGYQPALELARRLTTYMLRHAGYFGPDGEFGGDRHFHAHGNYMLGMLEYADAAGDRHLLELIRRSFAWAKEPANTGFGPVTGFSPEWGGLRNHTAEGCAIADMVAWALKLSAYGAGDYYEEAERWTRNYFAELQMTRAKAHQLADHGRSMPAKSPLPAETDDRVAERSVGAFGSWATGNEFWALRPDDLLVMHCCTGNGARALYWAWRHILDYRDGGLQVNMLLNRASPWADVHSYLPFQGRVDVKAKQDCSSVRVHAPEWITTGSTDIRAVDGEKSLAPRWRGRYVELGPLKKGRSVTLRFPIAERTVREKMGARDYALTVRGSTVVAVDPPGSVCPLFDREDCRRDAPRMHTVTRFVAERTVDY